MARLILTLEQLNRLSLINEEGENNDNNIATVNVDNATEEKSKITDLANKGNSVTITPSQAQNKKPSSINKIVPDVDTAIATVNKEGINATVQQQQTTEGVRFKKSQVEEARIFHLKLNGTSLKKKQVNEAILNERRNMLVCELNEMQLDERHVDFDDKLYHKDIFMPKKVMEKAKKILKRNKYNYHFSEHIKDNAERGDKDHAYTLPELWRAYSFIGVLDPNIFEIGVKNNKVVKFAITTEYDENRNVTFVLGRNNLIYTAWLNDKDDHRHDNASLNLTNLYEPKPENWTEEDEENFELD